MKILRLLAALLLLAPLSQSAWADLCIDPTTGGWATCSASATGPLGAPGPIGGGTPSTGAFTTLSVTGPITSTQATGTAPFTVASTTNVANLNASTLSGATFAAPGSIGSGTPAAGAFTTLSSSSGMALSSLATQATNTVAGNATSGTAVPTALAVGTCSTSSSALKWTTNTGFGCNTAINAATSTGVTDASAAAAGVVGELYSVYCPGTSTATITVTIATPAVVTWSSHPFSATGPANWTCPINFTTSSALPTGIVAGTNYFIIGSSLSGDTFQIADTAAHAISATNAVATSGSQSGTQTGWVGALLSTGGNGVLGADMAVVAGDWDCSGVGIFGEITTLTGTGYFAGINANAIILGAANTFSETRTPSGAWGANNSGIPTPIVQENISATTNIGLSLRSDFTVGTQNGGAFLRCRRMR